MANFLSYKRAYHCIPGKSYLICRSKSVKSCGIPIQTFACVFVLIQMAQINAMLFLICGEAKKNEKDMIRNRFESTFIAIGETFETFFCRVLS